eukprot:CAMPEP_0194201952 /NCGR_PEP_ID=MMETSP0156-20130528/2102_1 /TAXON_ID=33649 /ORGANISM="Thalassionema nitzschioides, Strain L26-B" /LENGTH=226 /DNA_ID=CAMNT_0038927295 /DNA_START=41 /DNA_END=721 /DNA_ORIENTATION=-
MTNVKLYYYAATGLANQIRLALAVSGIDWDEVNPPSFPPSEEDKQKWRDIGKNTTTNIPMLEMPDGKVYTQSSAVLRAVARMGDKGLMPGSDDELYLTDKLLADASDLRDAAYKTFVNWGCSQEKADAFIESGLALHLSNFERQLSNTNDCFFVGSKLTIADISIYDAVTSFGTGRFPDGGKDLLTQFPKVKEWISRVESNTAIAGYISSERCKGMMKFGPETLGK